MKVIKGWNGKSIRVAEILEKINSDEDVLIVSLEDLPIERVIDWRKIKSKIFSIYLERCDMDYLIKTFRATSELRNFKKVVFYLNVKESDVYKFKELEYDLGLESILTVQSHADENLKELVEYEV